MKDIRNKYVSVVNNGNLTLWTGPNPTKDDEAIGTALATANAIKEASPEATAYPVMVVQILPGDDLAKLHGIHKKTGYVVCGSTGCTCCKSENFVDGLYDDVSAAIDSASSHSKRGTVRSQYSKTGIYTVREIVYEQLPDGRVIVGSRVFESSSFWESGEDVYDAFAYEGKEVGKEGSYSER